MAAEVAEVDIAKLTDEELEAWAIAVGVPEIIWRRIIALRHCKKDDAVL